MAKQKKQGHPGRLAAEQDPLMMEVHKLAERLTKLVPTVIRDKRFDPEDVLVAKVGSLAALHLLAVLNEKPTPAAVYGLGKHGYGQAAQKLAAGNADANRAEVAAAVARAEQKVSSFISA